MKNLVELLEKSAKKDDKTKIVITLRRDDKTYEILKEQTITLADFKGGVKKFVSIQNSVTLRWEDEPLELTINSVAFKFKGGKFALNMRAVVNSYIDSQNWVKTEGITQSKREARNLIYAFFDANCDNLLSVITFLKFVEKAKRSELINVVCNTNFLIEAKNE